MRSWILRSELEWATTQKRLGVEAHKADRLQGSHRQFASLLAERARHTTRIAATTQLQAERSADEVRKAYEEWRSAEQARLADEVDALNGLDDVVQLLRSGRLVPQ